MKRCAFCFSTEGLGRVWCGRRYVWICDSTECDEELTEADRDAYESDREDALQAVDNDYGY